LSGSEWREGD